MGTTAGSDAVVKRKKSVVLARIRHPIVLPIARDYID
jgi:hypothetical protein